MLSSRRKETLYVRLARWGVATATGLGLAACSPSPDAIKKVVEQNPDIIFNALDKNKEKFAEFMQKMSGEMRRVAQEKAQAEQRDQLENEMKNPKKVELAEDRAVRGKRGSQIVLVEYSDFQCPYCGRGYETVEAFRKKHGDKVVFMFKHLPLSFHPLAMPAAKRFEAIAMQSHEKAYKFHDEVFSNQKELGNGGEKWLDSVAKKVGADMAKLKKDMESETVKKRIEADMNEARQFGIRGTPGFVLNGIVLRGALPIEQFEDILAKRPSYN